MKVLVCNAGSTSLKFKLFAMPKEQVLAESRIERIGSSGRGIFCYDNPGKSFHETKEGLSILTYKEGIRLFLDYLLEPDSGCLSTLREIERVGFKTVLAKGYYGIHELTDEVIQGMKDYFVVAPAHNGPYLEAIEQVKSILPGAKLVGAFETAFHTTIPLHRRLYGVPYEWYETYGVQRYGYHGASHAYIADFIEQQEGTTGRLISCHLGGSGSLCAILDGKSVDTSFGFSLQTGILHNNRVGDMDAYIIPYLLSEGKTMDEIMEGLGKQGGLLGISGVSNDLRDITEEAEKGNSRAKLALDMYCYGLIRYIGSYYAELQGLDHLVFTGGIGENSVIVRSAACTALKHMGIRLDEARNRQKIGPEGYLVISEEASPVKVWAVRANEELGVARKTYSLPFIRQSPA